MSNWLNLPKDLVGLIVESLEFLPDIQRFAFVCNPWRSIAMERCNLFNPLLIVSYDENAETCNLYDPLDQKKIFRFHLPELHKKWCCGSSNGWLMTADDDMVVRLLHPFSRAQISLPRFSPLSPLSVCIHEDVFDSYQETGSWKSFFVGKFILSSSPLDPDCVFIIIGGRGKRISFCRSTDETWTTLRCNQFCDAIPYEGKIYAARCIAPAVVVDISSNKIESSLEIPPCRRLRDCEEFGYFIESSGDLLHVIRHVKFIRIGHDGSIDDGIVDMQKGEEEEYFNGDDEEDHDATYKTVLLEVFKFTHEEKEEQWERVTCLGDRALFIGSNQSFSLSVTRFPGYKANHIYFTDDSECAVTHHDTGEFNLENSSITFWDLDAHIKHGQPIWFNQQH